jgi:hypothetical protein
MVRVSRDGLATGQRSSISHGSLKLSSQKKGFTNFKKHTTRFEWHAEQISSADSSSAAICKTISYCEAMLPHIVQDQKACFHLLLHHFLDF